jgi:hypothetical protein
MVQYSSSVTIIMSDSVERLWKETVKTHFKDLCQHQTLEELMEAMKIL